MKFSIKIASVLFALVLILPFSQVFAADPATPAGAQSEIILKSIKQISAQEPSDELFLLITDLGSKESQAYTVPGKQPYFVNTNTPHPLTNAWAVPHAYWRDSMLDKVQNIHLWGRGLAHNEAAQVMITLVEADMAPWDLDDSLGTVKINLMNQNNQITATVLPYSHAKIMQKNGAEYTVQIKNGYAEYLLVFEVITNKTANKTQQ